MAEPRRKAADYATLAEEGSSLWCRKAAVLGPGRVHATAVVCRVDEASS